jgi:membrane protein YdbS with pleckstrin-like domain
MTSTNSSIYASKIDAWLVTVMALGALAALVACAILLSAPVPHGWVIAVPLLVITVGLPIWLFTTTRYQFQGSYLLIQSGPLKWRLPIEQIKTVSSTRNPLSSPALSLDRILIEYGQGKSIMISPKDRQGFLAELEVRRGAAI